MTGAHPLLYIWCFYGGHWGSLIVSIHKNYNHQSTVQTGFRCCWVKPISANIFFSLIRRKKKNPFYSPLSAVFFKLFFRCRRLFWHLKRSWNILVFFLLFGLFKWFLPTWRDSGHCSGFASSDFPCAFRPTGNDGTWQLRPAVWFNQLCFSMFYIDSCSWPIKVNKITLIPIPMLEKCPLFTWLLLCSAMIFLDIDSCLNLHM